FKPSFIADFCAFAEVCLTDGAQTVCGIERRPIAALRQATSGGLGFRHFGRRGGGGSKAEWMVIDNQPLILCYEDHETLRLSDLMTIEC
ncbi:MAG: hypothetical protein OIF58_11005, partial [Cohaesibacter sp.]|nr:hypothetical protein [Cohaesibacter sp.]